MSGLNAGQIREAVKWHDGLSNQQSLGIIRSAALEHARRLDLVERGEAVWVEKQDGEWPRPLLNRVAGAINGPLVPVRGGRDESQPAHPHDDGGP